MDLSNRKKLNNKTINLLITNSYGAGEGNFPLRGGIESIKAFKEAVEAGAKNIRLKICGPFNVSMYPDLHKFVHESDTVEIEPLNFVNVDGSLHNLISEERFHQIFLDTDVLLLPAMRIHSVSSIRALAYGIPVVCSNGWGFDEFINEETGFIAVGQDGVSTWKDENGVFREIYGIKNLGVNEKLVNSIKSILLKISNSPEIVVEKSKKCVDYANENFDINKRNKLLGEVFKGMLL